MNSGIQPYTPSGHAWTNVRGVFRMNSAVCAKLACVSLSCYVKACYAFWCECIAGDRLHETKVDVALDSSLPSWTVEIGELASNIQNIVGTAFAGCR